MPLDKPLDVHAGETYTVRVQKRGYAPYVETVLTGDDHLSRVEADLVPALGILQDKGFRVALVTDGRMSGASGKVPAAIHVSPEACVGGPRAVREIGENGLAGR